LSPHGLAASGFFATARRGVGGHGSGAGRSTGRLSSRRFPG
jgi:hypothetical protein